MLHALKHHSAHNTHKRSCTQGDPRQPHPGVDRMGLAHHRLVLPAPESPHLDHGLRVDVIYSREDQESTATFVIIGRALRRRRSGSSSLPMLHRIEVIGGPVNWKKMKITLKSFCDVMGIHIGGSYALGQPIYAQSSVVFQNRRARSRFLLRFRHRGIGQSTQVSEKTHSSLIGQAGGLCASFTSSCCRACETLRFRRIAVAQDRGGPRTTAFSNLAPRSYF